MMNAIELSQRSSSFSEPANKLFYRHLLWKDYRQMRSALIGFWLIMTAILLLGFVRQFVAKHNQDIFPDAFMLVLAAPTLAAMTASGILIGHERQTRTWNWSSSLPIPWFSSLLSRFVIWLLSSIVMVATLLIVFGALMSVCRSMGYSQRVIPEWVTPQVIFHAAVIVPLIVYVCFSLAALLWNDTLTAFVISAMVVSALYVCTSEVLPKMFAGNSADAANVLALLMTLLFLVLLAGVLMVKVFHWRWTSGQLASMAWAGRAAEPLTTAQRAITWRSAAWQGSAGSEFFMLLTHSLRSMLIARVLIVAATIGINVLVGGNQGPVGQMVFFCLMGAGALGVTVFAGDQSIGSYKFLADRGVRWQRLLAARLLPPFAFSLLPVLIVFAVAGPRFIPSPDLFMLVMVPVVFFVAAFCSLCSRMPMLSICMTVGAWILVFLAHISLNEFWYNVLLTSVPTSVWLAVIGTELVVVIVATVILIQRWLIYDRVRGVGYYVLALLLAIVPSHLLAIGLCFLSIPNVPWQGVPLAELKQHSTLPQAEIGDRLPLTMQGRLYSYDPSRIDDAVEHGYQIIRSNLLTESSAEPKKDQAIPDGSADAATEQKTESNVMLDGNEAAADNSQAVEMGVGLDGNIDKVTLEDEAIALKEMESVLDRLLEQGALTANLNWLSNEIENSAWIASYATQELKDLELARRAWKVNRQLLTLVDYTALDSDLVFESRLVSVLLRSHLTSADWGFLSTGGGLSELQPEPVSRETWTKLAKMRGTKQMQELDRMFQLTYVVFPLRWYLQRQTAYQLEAQIQLINRQPLRNPNDIRLIVMQMGHPIAWMIDAEAKLPRTNFIAK